MFRSASAFPGGFPGLGLVLLRAQCVTALGGALAAGLSCALTYWAFSCVLMLLIAAGLLTRVAGIFLSCVLVAIALSAPPPLAVMFAALAAGALALTLLGPGAWSLDARLRGRRVIQVGRQK